MFYDDFRIGDSFESQSSRSLVQDDIDKFARLTGDLNPLHVNPEYASNTSFRGTIAHGVLTIGMALGLWYTMGLTRDSVIALIALDKISYGAPVRPGDSIKLRTTVSSMRLSKSNANAGIVTFSDRVVNQEGTIVLKFKRTLMLRRKPNQAMMIKN